MNDSLDQIEEPLYKSVFKDLSYYRYLDEVQYKNRPFFSQNPSGRPLPVIPKPSQPSQPSQPSRPSQPSQPSRKKDRVSQRDRLLTIEAARRAGVIRNPIDLYAVNKSAIPINVQERAFDLLRFYSDQKRAKDAKSEIQKIRTETKTRKINLLKEMKNELKAKDKFNDPLVQEYIDDEITTKFEPTVNKYGST